MPSGVRGGGGNGSGVRKGEKETAVLAFLHFCLTAAGLDRPESKSVPRLRIFIGFDYRGGRMELAYPILSPLQSMRRQLPIPWRDLMLTGNNVDVECGGYRREVLEGSELKVRIKRDDAEPRTNVSKGSTTWFLMKSTGSIYL